MIFWRQLYSAIGDVHILSTMGLHMAEEIKELLMDFSEDAKDCPERRGFTAILEKRREEFGDVNDVGGNESNARDVIFRSKTRLCHSRILVAPAKDQFVRKASGGRNTRCNHIHSIAQGIALVG